MDVVSLCVSAQALLALNQHLCTEVKTFTPPSKELRGLQVELLELESVFQTIQTSLFQVPDLSPNEVNAISKILVKVADFLSSLQFRVKAAGKNAGEEKWQWTVKKSNIEDLRKQLISIRCELTVLVFSQLNGVPLEARIGCSQVQRTTIPRVLGITRSIRPCYVLIFLGLLTIVGSLVPALWRSISHNDIAGGFSLAQYILGVGVFVIGCVVAIHSRTCNCWSSSNRAFSPNHGSSMELEAVPSIPNVQPYELPG